ncbi:GYF domain-containing protein [Haloferula helveola]
MAHWYYGVAGNQKGPVEEHEIRAMLAAGQINSSTIVWREGMDTWKPISEVPEWSGQVLSPQASPYQTPQAGYSGGYSPVPVVPNSGMAIASLVCGISSLVLLFSCFVGILAGIPAVICGHMALKQIKEAELPMGGRGMAIAGLVTGYVTIGLTVAGGILFGALFAREMP